jgi:NNP family nitrate/nitrite transporter-like MFS transporter
MYWTFGVMLVTTGILMMPNGHIVVSHPDGSQTTHLGYQIGLPTFAILVFFLGVAMGIGKAAVYKHIPEYFPDNVGSVGGLVGMFGGLGGFVLPLLFAYTKVWSGFRRAPSPACSSSPSARCDALDRRAQLHSGSPELADHFDTEHMSTRG